MRILVSDHHHKEETLQVMSVNLKADGKVGWLCRSGSPRLAS